MKVDTGADIVLRWDGGTDERIGRMRLRGIDGMRLKVGIGMRRMGLVLIRLGLRLLFGSRRDEERWDEAGAE